MNKTDLIAKMAGKAGLTRIDAGKVVDGFISAVTETLKNGDKFTMVGFGTFKVVNRKARDGRNPLTGETIKIEAKKVPKFVAGKVLKDLVL